MKTSIIPHGVPLASQQARLLALAQLLHEQIIRLIAAMRRLRPTGVNGVALDAINESVSLLKKKEEGRRRILLLIGESRDRGSKAKLEQSLAGQYAVPPTQLQAFAKANLQYQGIAAKLGKGNAQAGSTAASAYISDLSTKMGVSVSPRFGVWDAKQLAVTPPANELSSPAVSSPTGAVPQSTSTP